MTTESGERIRKQAYMHGEKFLRQLDNLCKQYGVTFEGEQLVPLPGNRLPSQRFEISLDHLFVTTHIPDEEALQRIVKQNEHARFMRTGAAYDKSQGS